MFDIIFQIWYFIVILPILIFQEGNSKLAGFLKKKNIYQHWDNLHAILVILLVAVVIIWWRDYR